MYLEVQSDLLPPSEWLCNGNTNILAVSQSDFFLQHLTPAHCKWAVLHDCKHQLHMKANAFEKNQKASRTAYVCMLHVFWCGLVLALMHKR